MYFLCAHCILYGNTCFQIMATKTDFGIKCVTIGGNISTLETSRFCGHMNGNIYVSIFRGDTYVSILGNAYVSIFRRHIHMSPIKKAYLTFGGDTNQCWRKTWHICSQKGWDICFPRGWHTYIVKNDYKTRKFATQNGIKSVTIFGGITNVAEVMVTKTGSFQNFVANFGDTFDSIRVAVWDMGACRARPDRAGIHSCNSRVTCPAVLVIRLGRKRRVICCICLATDFISCNRL